MARFSDRFLKALTVEPGRKDRLLFDEECPGLGVRVTAKGTKSFLAQWTDPMTKQKVREPIGVWGSITIDQARTAARSKLGDVAKGLNPAIERKRKKAEADASKVDQAFTLDKLISSWADLHLASRRQRYREEAQRSLRHAFSGQLTAPAKNLTRMKVVEVLDAIARAGKAATVTQTIAFGRACYNWALKRGRVPANPFQSLPIASTSSERDRVLSDEEVRDVWEAAKKLGHPFGTFYQLALLTLQRREEVAGMSWSEISLDGLTWTIPAERMKNNRPHDVYLSRAARQLLASLPRFAGSDLVFTTNGRSSISGYSKAKVQLDVLVVAERAQRPAAAGSRSLPPWRLHDFRRTGVSKLASLGIDSIHADKVLAHKPAKLRGVASVYQRYEFADERRHALDVWGEEVLYGGGGSNGRLLMQKVRLE